MQTSLKVKDIKSFTHEFVEYVCISVYFSGLTKNDFSALTFIARKIHLINDLKIKMLIENDLLNSKNFIIDIEKKSTTIENCEINISLKIQSKESYIRKIVHAQNIVVLLSSEKQLISIKIKIFENRNFFFESDANANFTMCSHILNTNTKQILIKNEFVNIVKVSRRIRLNQISKMNCDNCFQISETDMTVKSFKKNKLKQAFVTISMISTIKLTNMKIKLFNEFMIYENENAKKAYTNLINEFSIL